MTSGAAAAERPSKARRSEPPKPEPTSDPQESGPRAALPLHEVQRPPEAAESGLTYPVIIHVDKGKADERLVLERVSGEDFRYESRTDLPQVKVEQKWKFIKNGLPQKVQERFVDRLTDTDPAIRKQALEDAESFWVDYIGHKINKLSELRRQKRSAAEDKTLARLESEMHPFLGTKRQEQQPAPTVETPSAADTVENAVKLESEALAIEEESDATEQEFAPTAPIPELQPTLVAKYGESVTEDWATWMGKTLGEHDASRKLVETEAVVDLSESTLEREPRAELIAAYAAAKIENDRQVAALNPATKYETLRETIASLEKVPAVIESEKPIGPVFAAAVVEAVQAAKPAAAKRRFLPAGVAERLRSAIVGEFGEAIQFKRATAEAAREYLESVQDRILFTAPGTKGQPATGGVVEGAVAQLHARLSKLHTFSGEGMQERLATKETEVRQLLEAELAKSTGLLKDSDIDALAEKLRSNIDQRYWWRYVVGAAELAVAGAVGGYFAFWKSAATAAKFGPRVAATAAKKVARATLMRTARAHVPAFHLPGLSTTPDELAVHSSLWATVRRAAAESGLHPKNSELMRVVIKVAKDNGIAVKAWGLAGKLKDTSMPDGMLLRGVHAALKQIVAHV